MSDGHRVEICPGSWIDVTVLSDPPPGIEKCDTCGGTRPKPVEDPRAPSAHDDGGQPKFWQSVPPLTLSDFHIDELVLYVPKHAAGDESHGDCELGIVDSVSRFFVFVKFDNKPVPEACDAADLRKR